MSRMVRRILGIYVIGTVLVAGTSFVYHYLQSYLFMAIIIGLAFLITYAMPLLFRLFLKARPYDGTYKKKLLSYAREHGVHLRNLYSMPSKRSNASAFGFLNNKTVCFNANTLENHPWGEIQGVMAHELGHHVNGDIYFYTTVVALILIASSFVNSIVYSFFPQHFYYFFLISFIATAILLPIVLAISRWREGMADTYAKRILDEPAKLARFLERMLMYEEKAGEENSKNLTFTHAIFSTHPWVFQRIRYLKN